MHYYNLHTHSTYSLLDSVIKVGDYVDWAKERNLDAVALTEHGTLSSAYELWLKCKKAGVKPILGIEAYFVDNAVKDEGTVLSSYSHVCLFAKNKTGWENLKKLQSFAWTKGFYKKPRIDWSALQENHEGIIASSACTGGLIGSILLPNKYYALFSDKDRAKMIDKRIESFKSLFGADFYLEVMFNDLDDQKTLNKQVLKLSRQHNVKVIITNDSHYVKPSDTVLHDIIKVTQFRKTLNDTENGTYDTRSLYLVGLKGLNKLRKENHPYIDEETMMRFVKNSSDIVKKIENYNILGERSSLPKFADGAYGMLVELCNKGKTRLYAGKWNKIYDDRLAHELEVIKKLKMSDYFLIVWDIAREARKRNIPFSTRGSVAGSLVANLIGISWIDPIKFKTTFERFLTDDRLTLPDIDMDFGTERRGELIEYLCHKYGDECVAHIVNFSIYKPKQAIKDVARAYGVPFSVSNRITGLIPDGTEEWDDIPPVDEITRFFEANPDIPTYAKKMLGLVRNRGVHASGVVLTPGNIIEWLPVAYSLKNEESQQNKVVEFDMYMLDDNNILKLDFLGQNTLDIIQYTLNLINGDMKSFDDLYKVILGDLDNKRVFKSLCTGSLTGIFQMGGSTGMQELVKQIQPKTVEDISIAIALYRTAILKVGGHTKYINRRNGKEKIRYLHPKMESVLASSKGILLFQEQVGLLAVKLAGFTPTEADNFRKGIKQKDSEKFKLWEDKFIKGCKTVSGIDNRLAKEIWDEINAWAGYGFNLSHAIAYALIGYITAWLKTFYPVQFMTALMSYNIGADDKLNLYLRDAKKMGLKVIKPNINVSSDKFRASPEHNRIIYPLSIIKNVGEKAVTDILAIRKKGKFKSFEDFYDRVTKRVVNVRVIVNLVLAGCFRKLGTTEEVFDKFIELSKEKGIRSIYCTKCKYRYPLSITAKKVKDDGCACPECGSVEVITDINLIKGKKFNMSYCNSIIFGVTVDDVLKPYLGAFISHNAVSMKEAQNCNGEIVVTGAMVSEIRKHIDKNGNEMGFLKLFDGVASYDLIVFSNIWAMFKDIIKKNGVYIIRVKVDGEKFLLYKPFKCDKDYLIMKKLTL